MKKFFIVCLMVLLSLFTLGKPVLAEEDLLTMAQNAGYPATADMVPKASIVIDADTGQLLWGQEIDMKWDPASTTKTMVIYLTLEAIAKGQISLDTQVVATETDQAIAGIYALSNNKIVAGETYTVSELLTMTLVPSSNVTTLMLAHLIHDGDDASFLQLMNDTAKELGMTNTTFHNATGAVVAAFQGYYAPAGYDHNKTNEVTARDMAILTYHLLKKHPQILEYTNQPEVTVKTGTYLEETFTTYNYSLPGAKHGIEGVDGLKTGSSPTAGFNSIVTAKRGDTRLISVVLGVGDWQVQGGEYFRHYFVNTLLEKSFSEYSRQVVAKAGKQEIAGQTVRTSEDLYALVSGEQTPDLVVENNRLKVKDSIITESGVALEEEKGLGQAISTSNKVAVKKTNQLISKIPKYVYILIPIALIVLAIALRLILGSSRRARSMQHLDSTSRSRRHRRRRKF
ncbi:serine hydrolase [Streptococcus cameli]